MIRSTHKHRPSSAAAKIVERLSSCPEIAAILPANVELVSAGGRGGGWSWVIKCEDFHIGSDCPRTQFSDAPGIFVSLVSFDQIECSPQPTPGISLNFEAEIELARHAQRMKSTLTNRQKQILGINQE
jgi:hypothetical protein